MKVEPFKYPLIMHPAEKAIIHCKARRACGVTTAGAGCAFIRPDDKEAAMRPTRLRVLLFLAVFAVGLAACGDDEDDVGDLPPVTDETPAEPAEQEESDPTPEPTPAERVYEVQSGDTLWDIAQEFGTTVEAIVEANDLDDPDRISPGDELVIPVDG